MSTFVDLQNRIADDINRPELTVQIKKAITRAIEYYEHRRFWFTEKTWTFSTSAATASYTFSAATTTDLLEPDVVTLTRSSTDIYPLEYIPFQTYREWVTSGTSSQGPPCYYAIWDSTWFFWVVPDATYTITVYGQQAYTALSADADTNDWTTDGEDLIEARARWWLYARVIQDFQKAQAAKQEEIDAAIALDAKTIKLTSTGHIRPWL